MYDTPFGVKKVASMHDENKLNSARLKLMERDKQQVMSSYQENNVYFMVAYDEYDPFNSRPEGVKDAEARVFLWELLQKVFKKKALSLDKFYLHDVLAVWDYAWQAYYNGNWQVDRAKRIELLDPSRHKGESMEDFLERYEGMLKQVNKHSDYPVPLEEFTSAILISLLDDPDFGKRAEELNDKGVEYNEAKSILLAKELKMSEVKFIKSKKEKRTRLQVAHSARAEGTETPSTAPTTNIDEQSMMKLFTAFMANFKNGKDGDKNKKEKKQDKKECFNFKKHGACPHGKKCFYFHDPAKGNPANTALPKDLKCPECDGHHWLRDCKSERGKKVRAREAEAKERRKAKGMSAIHSGRSHCPQYYLDDYGIPGRACQGLQRPQQQQASRLRGFWSDERHLCHAQCVYRLP